MSTLMRHVVYAVRSLRKRPGFAVVTVLTLALGIGANTAIFSVVNGVVLRPLGYPAPGRLVFITSQFPTLGFDQFWISPPEFLDFRQMNRSFESVGAYRVGAVNLGTDRPTRPVAAEVSDDLLATLGVEPLAGRLFTRDDTLPGAEPVALLSYDLWQKAFDGSPSAVGRTVQVDGVSTRIVGVMPRGFDVHDQRVELWQPLTIDPAHPGGRGSHSLYLIGRLKDGVTLAQARDDLDRMLREWKTIAPNTHVPNPTTHRLRYDPLKDDIIRHVAAALWILQGAVGFVLLIACANLANLLLARSESRQKEFAIRTALGASRGRLLVQFVTEGTLLSLAGAAAGVGLAEAGLRLLVVTNPDAIPRTAEIAINGPVLLFTLAVAVLTGLVFGLAPLLHLTARGMNDSLKESGARTTAGAAKTRTRNALVVGEVALAVVLVVGAGLLLRSFWNLMQVDPGFDRSHLVTFGVVLPSATYPNAQKDATFFRELTDRIRAVPGVSAAAVMSGLPPYRRVNANDTEFEGIPKTPDRPPQNVDYYQFITAGYLETMGIPVVDGRSYTLNDVDGPPVVLVNQTLAKTFYPGESPIGRRIRPPWGSDTPWFTIIGVVRDVKQGGLGSKTGTELYLPFEVLARIFSFPFGNMHVVVRTALPLGSVGPALRGIVRDLDPSLPVVDLRTMDEVFADSTAQPRFLTLLLGLFGGLALVLAALGTYGILSYLVSERRQEIGIRLTLGASRGQVLGMVLGRGAKLVGAGLVLGVAGAVYLTRLMGSLLFGVRPADPLTIAAVSALMAVVALVACVVPAHRATRVDPMTVLRAE
jgi:putative ABC transport system permease protein